MPAGQAGAARPLFSTPESYRIVFLVSLVTYLLQQAGSAGVILQHLFLPDNDDAMRLLSVRDLLAGQGWFDTVQYRILPPEGVNLHWSRYVDAPIAALQLLLRPLVGPAGAEAWSAVLWPMLLFVALLVLTARTAKRLFGVQGANFAMLSLAMMAIFTDVYFPVGRIDHHNVQILCMTVMTAALVLPGAPLRQGLWAGAAAGFSMAVGLEAMLFIALFALVLAGRWILLRPGADSMLGGFGLAFPVSAALLLAGQTAPAEMALHRCDELGWPFLAAATAGGVAALILVWAGARRPQPALRLGLAALIGAGVLAVLAPVLMPCAAGPYADLPDEVRAGVIGRIYETFAAPRLFAFYPSGAVAFLLPGVVTVLGAGYYWLHQRRREGATHPAAGPLLVLAAAGVGCMLVQIRLSVMAYAVVPLLFGWLATQMLAPHEGRRRPLRVLGKVLAMAAVLAAPLLGTALMAGMALMLPRAEGLDGPALVDANCTAPGKLRVLSEIPQGRIMAPLNFGSHILLLTDHAVAAAPYHRSPEAMTNGVIAFSGDAAQLRSRIDAGGLNLVVVCKGEEYGPGSIGSALSRGEAPDWLQPVPLSDPDILAWRVIPDS